MDPLKNVDLAKSTSATLTFFLVGSINSNLLESIIELKRIKYVENHKNKKMLLVICYKDIQPQWKENCLKCKCLKFGQRCGEKIIHLWPNPIRPRVPLSLAGREYTKI
jgi:hypothetical protein